MPTLLLFLLTALLPPAHDYHVSKTNVRYVAEAGQLQVEMHLFADDLEAALVEAGAPTLDLGTEQESAAAPAALERYLAKHFRLKWNGDDLAPELLGWELADDLHGLWLYLAVPVSAAPDEVVIENTVLTEYYADQKNIVKLFDGDDRRATLLLSRDRPAETYAQ